MGPLHGVKIVELACVGPGPMCAMLLADLGATVLRIDRKQPSGLGIGRPLRFDVLLRNRKSIALDLKNPLAITAALDLISRADALIEGFRPGVTERLGLGPDVCLERNPRLVYGRMTGWGQSGPLAHTAGHDLGYVAVTGVLNAIGRRDAPPTIPLNLVGDYGGGALYLALGLLSGIIEARTSGRGQVVDAAIVDGTASLASTFFGMHAAGIWRNGRGTNFTDSGSHFYEVYECADGGWMSVAALEPKFYAEFLRLLGLDAALLGEQMNPEAWPLAKAQVAARFKTRTRDDWMGVFEGSDACVAPVLDWDEAARHPHLQERKTLIEIDGITQPAPAPRFSRTVPPTPLPPAPVTPDNTRAALEPWADPEQIAAWHDAGLFD
ncbi:MAG: CaiB/BaiF CoA transferase family protein [Steroidobacteraceae bacterium]